MATCLYFGTFNPIHSGHLMIAQTVLNQFSETLGIRSITFIPANNPPHRQQEPDLLAACHRFRMVQLATASHPQFFTSDIELQRPGRSFTIETVRQLVAQGKIETPVPMIIGSDALEKLHTWHEPLALTETVIFLQAPRPKHAFVETLEMDGQTVKLNTHTLEMPMIALSSSWIRAHILQNGNYQGLRYFVPEPARTYMAHNKLYLGQTTTAG